MYAKMKIILGVVAVVLSLSVFQMSAQNWINKSSMSHFEYKDWFDGMNNYRTIATDVSGNWLAGVNCAATGHQMFYTWRQFTCSQGIFYTTQHYHHYYR